MGNIGEGPAWFCTLLRVSVINRCERHAVSHARLLSYPPFGLVCTKCVDINGTNLIRQDSSHIVNTTHDMQV